MVVNRLDVPASNSIEALYRVAPFSTIMIIITGIMADANCTWYIFNEQILFVWLCR